MNQDDFNLEKKVLDFRRKHDLKLQFKKLTAEKLLLVQEAKDQKFANFTTSLRVDDYTKLALYSFPIATASVFVFRTFFLVPASLLGVYYYLHTYK